MKPLIQTVIDGQRGNCYGTALFSILELDPQFMPQVPATDEEINTYHIAQGCDDHKCHYTIKDKTSQYWHDMWGKWKRENNILTVRLPYQSISSYDRTNFDCFHIINGRSPRDREGTMWDGRPMLHSVVGKKCAIYHDVHPSGAGLLTLDDIELIVPRDPSKSILEGYRLQIAAKTIVDSNNKDEVKSA